MRSQQTVDPAGRTAAAGNDRDNLREHIKSVFETAIGLGLENAKQVGFAHAVDHIVGHAAIELGLLGTCAYELCDIARTRQEFGHIRSFG